MSGREERNALSRERVAEIFEKAGALVLRRCRMLLGSEEEAEDVMQEVFIRLMRYGASIRAEEVPLAWLYRTAERCCFDRLRKRTREPVPESWGLVQALKLPDGSDRREAAEMVRRFFEGLSARYKQLALLHYVDGLPQERIGQQLGWSRRTVGKKLKRLRQRADRLARMLDKEQE